MHKYFGEIATLKLLTFLGLGTLAAMAVTPIQAQTIYWTSWTSGSTAVGSITTPTTTLGVTYNNPQGIGFAQYTGSGGIDYWTNSAGIRNPARSPYTSATVANIPTGTDIIALRFAGQQSLTFSVAIANPVFSYVSLNGNGYAFDRDFNILSFGDGTVRDAGYWGAGSSTKQIVDIGGGVLEYRLIGGGEPHGTLQFLGSFNTVSC